MERLTVKSSTIFISVGEKTSVYRSVNEVPPQLRKKLRESTNGINAATIMIADRNGREEIIKALQGMPNGLRSKVASAEAKTEPRSALPRRLDWRLLAEILLPGAVGLLIWLAFNYK